MIETILIALLCVSSLCVGCLTIRAASVSSGFWVNPLLFPVMVWLQNYPLRLLILLFVEDQNKYQLRPEDMVWLSGYCLLFFCVFHVAFTSRRNPAFIDIHFPERQSDIHQATFFVRILAIAYIASQLYKIATGSLYTLYDTSDAIQVTAGNAIAGTILQFKWFLIPLTFFVWRSTRTLAPALLVIYLLISDFFFAAASTSKGTIVNLILLTFILLNISGKRVKVRWIFLALCISLVFASYSYYARYSGTVRGTSNLDDIANNIGSFIDSGVINNLQQNSGSSLERVSGYADGLVLMSRDGVAPPGRDPLYIFGSLVELGNFVPRSLWPDRPHLSFNHYITWAVWGVQTFMETPIGRIGESFYVASYFGVFYALLYACAFASLMRFSYSSRTSAVGSSLYFAIWFLWVNPDAYLIYNLKALIALAFMIVILRITYWAFATTQQPNHG